MNRCIAPYEIQEGDLAAYLDGAASPQVVEHIARCPACARAVQELRAADAWLGAALYRDRCPSPLTLLEYQSGFLPPAERRQVADHLRTCAECQQELSELATPVETPQRTPQPTVPVSRSGRQDKPFLQQLKAAGKRLLTAVQLPAPRPAAPAWRGEDQPVRIYRAGAYRVVLSVVPPLVGNGPCQIEGQILHQEDVSSEPLRGTVQLWRQGKVWGQEAVDDLGFFALDNMPRGRYTLTLDLPEMGIVVEDFAIP